MAGTLNKVMLIGNLGKDPEVRNFDNGGMLVRFPIATTENFTDRDGNRRENTEWHTIVVRSPRLAEVCERYLKKGDKVFIEGKIRSRQWTDDHNQTRYNIEIAADSMTMLGPNPMRSSTREEGEHTGTPRAAYRNADDRSAYGSDLPSDQGEDDFPF
ncbi:single-stranded DNA-binding protein [Schleiferiaceae bacterium]|jgi:single-strand DNA-binding protein|nr:single-stranded DNA-binding protein [Schleiferiaceae bacterium]MDC3353689.1 single-stranded DNA-binding protein [Schleiferiaceae bacterium]